jgi:hypothetical protein
MSGVTGAAPPGAEASSGLPLLGAAVVLAATLAAVWLASLLAVRELRALRERTRRRGREARARHVAVPVGAKGELQPAAGRSSATIR